MRHLSQLFDESPRGVRVAGGVLLVLALVLLGFTEYRARLSVMAADALGGFVRTGSAATPGPDADGQLVLAVGAPVVKVPAQDAQFGVAVSAPALVRKVEMFQWTETRSGGHVGYEMDWFDHPIDSGAFRNPAGHANPGAFPIGAARFDSPDVQVAGFHLAPALVALIAGAEPFKPNLSHLAPNMAATFEVRDGTLVTSADAAHPKVGDLRVRWLEIAPSELTVFARDLRGTLEPAHDAAGNAVAQVLLGRLSLADVLNGAPRPPRLPWSRRLLSLLMAWAGIALLLPEPHRRDPILALALAVVPLAALAAAAWFDVRTPAASILVIVAVLAAVVTAWRWRWPRSARSASG